MKRVLALMLLAFVASCSTGSSEEVNFKLSQPLGQKSAYTMKNRLKVDSTDPTSNSVLGSQQMELDAAFDTEVTASEPDGQWTLQSRFNSIDLKVNGERQDAMAGGIAGKTFTVTMDKDGKVIDVKGSENLPPGMDVREMMKQMNPTNLLPDRSVRVGESWPVEVVTPMQLQGATLNQTLKGTGTLTEVTDGQAIIDLDYTIQMSMLDQGPSGVTMSGNGKGKSRMAYDLERARFTMNKNDLTLESTGEMSAGDRVHKMKSTMTSSIEVNLVNK
ncbi:MAG TPA: DUF6263 family protein [Blastocatellia bacterium]|nr:DUF6263 family protein [Blastocatellia bacterium]